MEIRHLSNSGFAAAHGDELLLFDCVNYRRSQRRLQPYFDNCSEITAFVSHSHPDHWGPDIANAVRKLRGTVVGWSGISGMDVPLNKGESATVSGSRITAFGSTDEGVSFCVRWNGYRLFHAGDLNLWDWRHESTEAEIAEATAAFEKELADIADAIPSGSLDVAFFPVDPRMGEGYWEGAVRFAEVMNPRYLVPMHFGAEFAPPDEFFAALADRAPDTRLWSRLNLALNLPPRQ